MGRKSWTKEEKQYLIDNYSIKTQQEIADYLGRSLKAVSKQARNLGLFVDKSIRYAMKITRDTELLDFSKCEYSGNDTFIGYYVKKYGEFGNAVMWKVECKSCGNIRDVSKSNFVNGVRCACHKTYHKTKTDESLVSKLCEERGYTFLRTYTEEQGNMNLKVRVVEVLCPSGNFKKVNWNPFRRGTGICNCFQCANKPIIKFAKDKGYVVKDIYYIGRGNGDKRRDKWMEMLCPLGSFVVLKVNDFYNKKIDCTCGCHDNNKSKK